MPTDSILVTVFLFHLAVPNSLLHCMKQCKMFSSLYSLTQKSLRSNFCVCDFTSKCRHTSDCSIFLNNALPN